MKKLSSKMFGSLAVAALFFASMSFTTTVSAEDYGVDKVEVSVNNLIIEVEPWRYHTEHYITCGGGGCQ